MKEGDMPSQNLADFCSLSFTLLSSYREPITSYAFNDKKNKQTNKKFCHKFNSLRTHLRELIIL